MLKGLCEEELSMRHEGFQSGKKIPCQTSLRKTYKPQSEMLKPHANFVKVKN
jgi:hypothetical protein